MIGWHTFLLRQVDAACRRRSAAAVVAYIFRCLRQTAIAITIRADEYSIPLRHMIVITTLIIVVVIAPIWLSLLTPCLLMAGSHKR